MLERMLTYLQKNLHLDRYDILKLLFCSGTFFCVIGAYSILRSFKTSIFLAFVGPEYEPYAKVLSILVTIPVMLFYAKIIDKLKKHRVVYFFLGIYVVLTLLFAYLFAHPVYGVANTQTSPYRFLGWIFEFFMDLTQALVVGTFWSFVNSISTPDFANKSYGVIVASSRLGGILTTVISWVILEKADLGPSLSISVPMVIAAIFFMAACYCIYTLKRVIPLAHLHGYEAAYQLDRRNERQHKQSGIFEGLRLVLTEPYVLGIFGLVFSFEVINIIFDYQMHILMSIENQNQVHEMSKFMLMYTGSFQLLSLLFAAFGTSQMIKRFGVQTCLLVMPLMTIFMAVLPILYPKLVTVFIVMVGLRGLHYGFNYPVREILFIPTTKDIQFKSKAWIDSFGRTASKTAGSTLNIFAVQAPYFVIVLQSIFSIALALLWCFIALLVGRKYLKTLNSNAVIGENES